MTERDPTRAVQAAGALWDAPEQAEAILLAALDASPESEMILVALYRFYFYRGEWLKAIALAERCITHSAKTLGIDSDWRMVCDAARVADDGLDFADYALPQHRFYLFSLNAYGYLLARVGRLADSEAVLSAVKRRDPQDRIGGGRLLDVVRTGPDLE